MTVVHSVAKILMVSVAGAALACALPLAPAQAGFDWTPPAGKVVAPAVIDATQPDPNLLTPEPDAAHPVTPVEGSALQPADALPVPAPAPVRPVPAPVTTAVQPPAAPAPAPVIPAPVKANPPGPAETAPTPIIANAEPTPAPTPAEPAEAPKFRHISRAESHAQYEASKKKQDQNLKTVASRPEPAAPAAPVSAPLTAPEELAGPAPAAPSGFDEAPLEGFGKDISLAIALSQIVPPTYAFKFAEGVNPGQKVSWQGGKPWTQVLSDVLVANGLEVVIQGNVVKVQQPQTASASYAPAPEAAQVPQEAQAEKVAEAPVEEPAPAQEPAANKVARLAPAATHPEGNDLPVPTGAPKKAPLAPADKPAKKGVSEAQASEASEKEVVERSISLREQQQKPVAVVASRDAKAPVIDVNATRKWEAAPGKTLRETLEGWSREAGAELEWMSPYDYPVDHAFAYDGKYEEAVESLLALYSREEQRPRGRLYPNLPTGPSVLMIN